MPYAAKKSVWCDVLTDQLRELWTATDDGRPKYSCRQIADMLDVTRNAVISKVHRIGLPGRETPVKTERPRRVPSLRRRNRAKKPRLDLFIGPAPIPEFIGIPFVETTDKTCMYPAGDGASMLFCGSPRIEDSSYCAGHHRVCWVKPDRKPSVWRGA